MTIIRRPALNAFGAVLLISSLGARADDRIHLDLDTSEADAVLAILDAKASGRAPDERDWNRLFSSQPYIRLKKREASLKVGFTDDEFRTFVLSIDTAQQLPALRRTLEAWQKKDLVAAAQRVLPYLPEEARIRAKVYLLIKPERNSFVYDLKTDPTIFLYLDPEVTAQKFENNVAHELHHIGFSSVRPREEAAKSSPPVRTALDWMGAFGEGFAMLAAAGSPDVHPQAASATKERMRWDHDMENFNQDLKALEKFFLDILDQRLKASDEIEEKAMTFFGVQGPWYTVGYRMAVVIEKHDGRAELIACMSDPVRLLRSYNRAAADLNAKGNGPLVLWSPELLARISRAGE